VSTDVGSDDVGSDKRMPAMNDTMFLAVDLEGAIWNAALCTASPGCGVDSTGWMVRSSIVCLYSWLGAGGNDLSPALAERLSELAGGWGVTLSDLMLVKLGPAQQEVFVDAASSLGAAVVCFPATAHIVSPRGVAPAVEVKDYVHRLEPPRMLDVRGVRDAFVTMMERAAEDVQADGLEQDDSFLDRYAELRIRGHRNASLVPVEELSDDDWAVRAWRRARPHGPDVNTSEVEIVSLRLRCVIDTQATFRPALPATDGRMGRARIAASPDAREIGPMVYDRSKLLAGDGGTGPVTLVDGRTSIRVPANWRWEMNRAGHLLCHRQSP